MNFKKGQAVIWTLHAMGTKKVVRGYKIYSIHLDSETILLSKNGETEDSLTYDLNGAEKEPVFPGFRSIITAIPENAKKPTPVKKLKAKKKASAGGSGK